MFQTAAPLLFIIGLKKVKLEIGERVQLSPILFFICLSGCQSVCRPSDARSKTGEERKMDEWS